MIVKHSLWFIVIMQAVAVCDNKFLRRLLRLLEAPREEDNHRCRRRRRCRRICSIDFFVSLVGMRTNCCKKSNEGLAREALARREALLNQATGIQNQIDAQANNIDTLYDGMMALERKIVEAKGKNNQMIARARTAKSNQKINDMMSGLTGTTSMDALNRMEKSIGDGSGRRGIIGNGPNDHERYDVSVVVEG